jgi:hypothetical protein
MMSCVLHDSLTVIAGRTSEFPSLCIFIIILRGVRLSPLGTASTTGQLYQLRMIDDGDYAAISGIKIEKGNQSTRRKPTPVPLFPPQIPHDLTWARTLAAAVGSRRLTV